MVDGRCGRRNRSLHSTAVGVQACVAGDHRAPPVEQHLLPPVVGRDLADEQQHTFGARRGELA
jgi:hypothetical protein